MGAEKRPDIPIPPPHLFCNHTHTSPHLHTSPLSRVVGVARRPIHSLISGNTRSVGPFGTQLRMRRPAPLSGFTTPSSHLDSCTAPIGRGLYYPATASLALPDYLTYYTYQVDTNIPKRFTTLC